MLTNRQLLILQLTVDDFIESAQPVGSRQLSQKNRKRLLVRRQFGMRWLILKKWAILKKHIHLPVGYHLKKDIGFMSIILLKPEKLKTEDSIQFVQFFKRKLWKRRN